MPLYWVGPGVFSHKGKDYEHGAELPGLDKDTAARLVKKCLAAEEVPRVGRPVSEASRVTMLTEERDQLAAQLKEAQETIEALVGQLEDIRKEGGKKK